MKGKAEKRPNWMKKQGHKGQKCLRGAPVNRYQELKKKITLSLTSTALAKLNALAEEQEVSRSEILERLLRHYDVARKLDQGTE